MSVQESWQEFAATAARQAGSLHVASVSAKVRDLHERIRGRYPSIARIAVALYDPQMRRLKTFVASNEPGIQPLTGYECTLDDVPSLLTIAQTGEARVVNDMDALPASDARHAQWLQQQGFLSSLTLPIRRGDELLGFLFFDAHERQVFTDPIVADLLLYGHLIGMIVTQELTTVQMLVGGLRLASQFAHVRDLETGAHLDRMARYSRLIARELSPSHGQPDEYAENIFLFAALHDIGKVGVPDRVLLKPGRLDDVERDEMRQHVIVGLQMAERMIGDFGLDSLPNIAMLRNIVAFHHERMDGSGYPRGLCGDEIPLEARIVATADVFDALACKRSYKPAWTLTDAFGEIASLAGKQLYAPAVQALLDCRPEVEVIYQRFQDTPHTL